MKNVEVIVMKKIFLILTLVALILFTTTSCQENLEVDNDDNIVDTNVVDKYKPIIDSFNDIREF